MFGDQKEPLKSIGCGAEAMRLPIEIKTITPPDYNRVAGKDTPPSELIEIINVLDLELGRHESALKELNIRLDPVLRPSYPHPCDAEEKKLCADISPLTVKLMSLVKLIRSFTSEINDMNNRLAL